MKLSGLDGKTAVVTGASRGIGKSIALVMAKCGTRVVCNARNQELLAETCSEIEKDGGEAISVAADVTSAEDRNRLIEQAILTFDGIDFLVNNAGVHDSAPFWEESEALWDRLYRVNVLGTVWPSQLAARHMQEGRGGAIVHVASKAGVVGEPGHAAYSASKGAVIALTRAMAVDLAPYSIRVNAVCPGPVMTDMLLEAVPTQAGRRELAETAPLGRVGRTQDIAAAVLYLASSDADWCTGQAISIDGGLSILK